jgi:3-hydroxy acid dehydrogenase/malonic semialdehyde reductase
VQQGGKVVTVQLDVADRAQVAALWSKVPQELRDVDILGEHHSKKSQSLDGVFVAGFDFLTFCFRNTTSRPVNNAGGAHGTDRVGDIQDRDIDTMFATNVFGLISLTQLLVKGLSCLSVRLTSSQAPGRVPHPLTPSSSLASPQRCD